jgi:hypothetical protein
MKERLTASLGDLAQLWGTSERMIENGAPLASDDAAAIVSAINRIDSEEMADVALNLRVARLTALDLRERDQLLVEASALHCWGSLSNRARRLSVEMRRYAASAWLHDRARLQCPERYRGKLREHLWRVLQICPLALSEGRVRKILSMRSIHGCVVVDWQRDF